MIRCFKKTERDFKRDNFPTRENIDKLSRWLWAFSLSLGKNAGIMKLLTLSFFAGILWGVLECVSSTLSFLLFTGGAIFGIISISKGWLHLTFSWKLVEIIALFLAGRWLGSYYADFCDVGRIKFSVRRFFTRIKIKRKKPPPCNITTTKNFPEISLPNFENIFRNKPSFSIGKSELGKGDYEQFLRFVKKLPLYKPSELYKKLEEKGYRGQKEARRLACLMVYRHIKRIKMIFQEKVPIEKVPPRLNYLFIGPTGCGKTFITELLFKKILNLPYIIIDITKYSETGYVGKDVIDIPKELINAADGNIFLANIGVVVLDEFDKIRGDQSTIGFIGAGKDVSGFGVQRELLKLLEGGIFSYSSNNLSPPMNVSNILFIGVGAFSGIKGNHIAYEIGEHEIEDIQRFFEYGFLPELIARFQRIIPFKPLDRETLKEILELKIKGIKNEFLSEGHTLEITPRAKDLIVSYAIRRQTGARAIESIILSKLDKIAFDFFGDKKKRKVIIDEKSSSIEIQLN